MYNLQSDEKSVQLWSLKHLQHEKLGCEMRPKLSSVIRRLEPQASQILLCEHSTVNPIKADIENVLIYNVREASFARSSRNGIMFRLTQSLPKPSPDGEFYDHLSEYSFTEAPERPDSPLIEFDLDKMRNPFDIWWAATAAKPVEMPQVVGNFELYVELWVPESLKNPGGKIKKVFDGIIASMHADLKPSEEAIEILAEKHMVDKREIYDRLSAPPNPLISFDANRRLVKPYRQNVQWHPDDGRCVSGTLIMKQSSVAKCVVSLRSIPSV
ncbi:hypothetical protein [Ahrensia sp. 13_GOM-1096m]|uniref:hypothetical protein n=1 Tax=Ahrensia sp. 13_GOM-1096m TaxID=1380380 RepID=UPI00047A63F6|nr:hypothetical protein [Ahrensia sp. 13_GOM-1096m]